MTTTGVRQVSSCLTLGFAVAAVWGLSQAQAQHRPEGTLLTIDASKTVGEPETGYLEMGSRDAGVSPGGSTLSVNSRYLVLDGKPWMPVMGEFHFSRFPPQYWEEEIQKMKAGGVQIIATYIFWIHHEEIEGKFDWTGQRDLRRFVRLCARNGLYVFPRIGPWAHGEARNGGFPDWLLAKCPTRVNDSTFLSYVRVLYQEIGTQVRGLLWKDGGPVIGLQVENEYGDRSARGGDGYLLKLKSMAVDAGLDVPLYTVTGWDNAVIPPHAFVPVYGGYPDEAWSGSRGELPPDPQGVFQFHVPSPVGTAGIMQTVPSAAEDVVRAHYPRFTAELGAGMEDTYHRRVVVSPDDVAAMTLSALGSGVNLIGYYMYHGGANPDGKLTTLQESQSTDYPNDVPVISYDFQAPLGEFGQAGGAFRKLKVMHQFIHDFGGDIAPMTAVLPDIVPSGPRDSTTVRVSCRADGKGAFLFFNNYLRNYPLPRHERVQVRLRLPSEELSIPDEPVDISSQSWFFWPVNFNMGGALLKYATAQPFVELSAGKDIYVFFMSTPTGSAEFLFDASTVDSVRAQSGIVATGKGLVGIRNVAPSRAEALTVHSAAGSTLHVVLLSPEDAENSWKVRLNGHACILLTTADVFAASGTLTLRSRNPRSLSFSIFPRSREVLHASAALKEGGREGIFASYAALVKATSMPLRIKNLRDAGVVPPVRMGKVFEWRNGAVASSPENGAFENAALWRLTVPGDMPRGVSDLFLEIHYAGDVGRLYDGKRLLDDNFFNGRVWEVGLKRFGSASRSKGLDLAILPLRKDAPIYVPLPLMPEFKGLAQVAELTSVHLSPEYELTLATGGNTRKGMKKFTMGADISSPAALNP